MVSLAVFQHDFRVSVQGGNLAEGLDGLILSDELPAASRMQVYQNNYIMTLTDVVFGVFPVVSAFVGEDFTRAAVKHFVADNPPEQACLSEYGVAFPAFLKTYEHASDVPYIGDMAKLEWAMYELQSAAEEKPAVLVDVVTISKNVRFIKSEYPILSLWMVGTGKLVPQSVHIDQGGQFVCALLNDGLVELLSLSSEEEAYLGKLSSGEKPKAGDEEIRQGLINKKIII
ncbi:MAG: putative DNA-binding domain-containing protein [Kordiimonadaceae bacterium]|nr:putative DNA-binding domain-containing protein [Kordiimonadaceae bacterium]